MHCKKDFWDACRRLHRLSWSQRVIEAEEVQKWRGEEMQWKGMDGTWSHG